MKSPICKRGLSGLFLGSFWALILVVMPGCMTGPSRIVVFEDDRSQVTIADDPSAGTGHQHPYKISPDQMAQILAGIWVKDRNAITGFGLFKDGKGTPAFSGTTVTRLADPLSRALGKASPRDLVTFYVTLQDTRRGPVVTSGGLFVRGDQLYFILANSHTMPSDTSNDFATAIELDNRDAPLEPIGRFRFTVGFSPAEAWISYAEAKRQTGYESYMDEAKMVVVNLAMLPKATSQAAAEVPAKGAPDLPAR